jgi:hypothetical protein
VNLQSAANRDDVTGMSKRRALLLLVGVVAFLVAGASLPHTHASAGPEFWNADHDLSLMAAFGTHACQLDATPVIGLALVLAPVIAAAAAHAASAPLTLSASRAPPRF